VTEKLRALLDPRLPPTRKLGVPERVTLAWRRIVDRLLPLGGSSDGNQVTLFADGDGAYDAMLAAIRSATKRVWLETYIFEPDRVGREFLDELLAARLRGAEVILIYDVVGSPRLSGETLKPLVDHGVGVVPFNPPFTFSGPLPRLMRDHRKILVVDDGVAFCGGMNVSVDYAGPRRGNNFFRDTHALVEGPAAAALAAIFASSFQTATSRVLPDRGQPPFPLSGGVFAQVLGSDARRRRRHIQRALYHTVGRCVRRCLLTTPYFVPPPRLLTALVRAARRGVDVRVLTAGLSDVPIASIAARHLYGRLLRGGVKVYEMSERTLHAKTATIDGVYASVGSFNLDRWSFGRNLEVNLTFVDEGLAAHLEDAFYEDLKLSREVKLEEHAARGPLERALGWLAYQLMRL
jgi:cardiolipin synthase A/B